MSADNKEVLDFVAALSPRERRLVQEIAAGTGHTWAAMIRAGYARSTAAKQSARTLAKPRIKRALIEVYHRNGFYLTDEELTLIGKTRNEEDGDK